MIIVIPSNRTLNLDYLAPLLDRGHRLIVVDDTPGSIPSQHPDIEVHNWGDRKRFLGELDDLFPRRNGACRTFGLLLAWRDSDPDDLIVALDDDCEVPAGFDADVLAAFEPRALPVAEGGERHFNIVDCYRDMPEGLFPRGFPYSDRLGYEPRPTAAARPARPRFNLGLWADAFDVNAIDKIAGPEWRHPEGRLRDPQVLVPPGKLVSVCSMNMQMVRDVVPAVYQWPMHVPIMPGSVIDRYGDIWGGFTLKALMDRAGDDLTLGAPMIAHRKAGDAMRNAWQEHLAHLVNDEVIELIVRAAEEASSSSYLDRAADFTEGLARRHDHASALTARYFDTLLPGLRAWTTALARAACVCELAYR